MSLPAADSAPVRADPASRRIRARIVVWATSPLVAGILAVVAFGLIGIVALLEHGHFFIDLAVYRAGGQAWLDARPLYDHPFPTGLPGQLLPFIYPPFAALCFVPLTFPPPALVSVVFTLGSVAALLVTVRVVGAAVHPGFRWPHAVWCGCFALALEPVWQTLSLGQINLYLMALVVVDLLAIRTTRRRGLLIGLAAAFKLTPAVFLLYLVAARQWRAVANAAAAFGAATMLALLIRPSESVTYWWRALGAPTQIGDLGYAGNQSVRGALHRLGWTHALELTCWVAVVALVLVLTGLALRRWRHGGFGDGGFGDGGFGAEPGYSSARADSAALVVVALAGVLISPAGARTARAGVFRGPATLGAAQRHGRARRARHGDPRASPAAQ
jgi:alpha-1,2-mannosyltransferase